MPPIPDEGQQISIDNQVIFAQHSDLFPLAEGNQENDIEVQQEHITEDEGKSQDESEQPQKQTETENNKTEITEENKEAEPMEDKVEEEKYEILDIEHQKTQLVDSPRLVQEEKKVG